MYSSSRFVNQFVDFPKNILFTKKEYIQCDVFIGQLSIELLKVGLKNTLQVHSQINAQQVWLTLYYR